MADAESFYALQSKTLEGEPAPLAPYAGKVALVVNLASQWGHTPQYSGLESLYRELKDKGFVVLGFPSNDFGAQEPGSPQEIRAFCSTTYAVSFPLFEKVVTREGPGQSPVYALLGKAAGQLPAWNFSKYLVGKDGQVLKAYKSGVKPDSPALRLDIEAALR